MSDGNDNDNNCGGFCISTINFSSDKGPRGHGNAMNFGRRRLGERSVVIDVAGERAAEGSDLLPVVATGEDSTQAEDDDQEEGSAERKANGRPRVVHPGRCMILTLHRSYCN
ncbi:hypothetical protein U1Q18_038599 [Sarracenia purpurea var. burkii]